MQGRSSKTLIVLILLILCTLTLFNIFAERRQPVFDQAAKKLHHTQAVIHDDPTLLSPTFSEPGLEFTDTLPSPFASLQPEKTFLSALETNFNDPVTATTRLAPWATLYSQQNEPYRSLIAPPQSDQAHSPPSSVPTSHQQQDLPLASPIAASQSEQALPLPSSLPPSQPEQTLILFDPVDDHGIDIPDTHAGASSDTSSQPKPRVDLVVASLSTSDTVWLKRPLLTSHFNPMIYQVNNPSSPLTVPRNKGQEAMVYLTYIIDHYSDLPDIAIFRHSDRYQWHSDDPDYDGVSVLRRLRLSYIQSEGYVNLRCVWTLGCPDEIRPLEDEGNVENPNKKTAGIYRQAFEDLLPDEPVPEVVAQSCCAQFAVTGDSIRTRERAEYERMRDWLLNTPLDDATAGRVFEYLWHIIFRKEAVYCPNAGTCYCKLFGICDIECEEGSCKDRYILPPSSSMPEKWPFVGWDGEARNRTATEV